MYICLCWDSNYGFVCEWNAPRDSIIFIELTDMVFPIFGISFCKWCLAYRYIIHLLWSTAWLLYIFITKKEKYYIMKVRLDRQPIHVKYNFYSIHNGGESRLTAGKFRSCRRTRKNGSFREKKSWQFEMIQDVTDLLSPPISETLSRIVFAIFIVAQMKTIRITLCSHKVDIELRNFMRLNIGCTKS